MHRTYIIYKKKNMYKACRVEYFISLQFLVSETYIDSIFFSSIYTNMK